MRQFIRALISFLRPLPKLTMTPEDLDVSLHYHKRRHKPLEVDSELSAARQMMFLGQRPGKYVGLGNKVITERRRWRRCNS